MNEMRYDVVIVAYKKPEYLAQLVECLKSQTVPPEVIYVWHNAPVRTQLTGVINIYSDHNFGCQVRHIFGQLCVAPIVVFIDDDILLSSTACETLLKGKARHPQCVVGNCGRLCFDDYSHGIQHENVQGDSPVTVVKGYFHAVERELLALATSVPHYPVDENDDIALCIAISAKTGKLNYVTAGFNASDIIHQSHSIGYEHRPDHYQRRDSALLASRQAFVGKSDTERVQV